jgi:hypothetical protein
MVLGQCAESATASSDLHFPQEESLPRPISPCVQIRGVALPWGQIYPQSPIKARCRR